MAVPGGSADNLASRVGSRNWCRLGALIAFVGAFTIALVFLDVPPAARLQEFVAGAGPFGVAGFVLGYGLLTLGPVPKPRSADAEPVVSGS